MPSARKTEYFKDCPTCPEMVVVPAGHFTMGSPAGEEGRFDDEGPQHEVTIAEPFAVGRYSFTRGEFAGFVRGTGYKTDGVCETWPEPAMKGNDSWRSPGFTQDDRHPVVCVNWNDAKAFCVWLSKQTGRSYRILSEAEREYVTRAGTITPFWWGSSITLKQANYGTEGGGSLLRTVPVGSFEPNPWGLYNVHGNVWEWTEDCWNDSNAGNPGDGRARTTGTCAQRVVRGGSWVYSPGDIGSAFRGWGNAADRINYQDFRLARTLHP